MAALARRSSLRALSGFSRVFASQFHGSSAVSGAAEDLKDAYVKIAPTLDPPATPTAYLKERPAVPSTIPEKLTLNFSLPHDMPYAAKEVGSV